jgi:hypothetical protein
MAVVTILTNEPSLKDEPNIIYIEYFSSLFNKLNKHAKKSNICEDQI